MDPKPAEFIAVDTKRAEPIARGQRRRADALFRGLIVSVVEDSPYRPGDWVCRAERTGCKIVVPDFALGELLPPRGTAHAEHPAEPK